MVPIILGTSLYEKNILIIRIDRYQPCTVLFTINSFNIGLVIANYSINSPIVIKSCFTNESHLTILVPLSCQKPMKQSHVLVLHQNRQNHGSVHYKLMNRYLQTFFRKYNIRTIFLILKQHFYIILFELDF